MAAAALGPAPGAQAAFGPESFEAGTCVNHTCTYSSVEGNHAEAFTKAAGHPEWGITKFVMKHSGTSVEGASVKRIRVDVPPGLAANPEALEKCSVAQFESAPSGCPAGSIVGSTEMEAVAEPLGVPLSLPSLSGTVYNLEPPEGLPLDFGIAVEPAGELVSPIHLFLVGHVATTTDYHEYFEIHNVPDEATVNPIVPVKAPLKVLMSKLNFNGRAGKGNFLTLPSVCSPTTTSFLELESWNGDIAHAETHTPVGVEDCAGTVENFKPSATVAPETSQSDAPDGATTVVRALQHEGGGEINTADIRDVRALLPEGLTLNPSAAGPLGTCSPAQFGFGNETPFGCPAQSQIGTVAIETDLPPGSLRGAVYLGAPNGTPLHGPPFTIYLDAESKRYGVSVKLQGLAEANRATGRLEVTFKNNPQLPFSELTLTLKGGPKAPLANPLGCGVAHSETQFAPWTGLAEWTSVAPFATSADGKGGACPSPLPFALAQSTQSSTSTAGAYTSFTFNLERGQGNQYVGGVRTVLPPGLVGAIPSVPLCPEPAAQAGSCPSSSQIGTASVLAGSGSEPESFSGPVYLTGPHAGTPYGLSIPIEAASGPFDLGRVVTRVGIGVDPHSARVVATASPPTIVQGVPLRLRKISVAVNRHNFLFNPSSCSTLHTESTITSTTGSATALSSPFALSNCSALPFKPTFSASTSAKTSRATGASLQVKLTQGAHEDNIRSVVVQLPPQLPSRLTTLQKACPEATYAANPRSCPEGSLVGTAVAATPVLPGTLSGPAYLVSHGGAAFPDLDVLLEGDGVTVILEGNTNIKNGITTSTFASIPDVPVSSFSMTLPTGPHSALAAFGSFCGHTLVMPTTITAQNGAVIRQSTHIGVTGCGIRIVRTRIKHRRKLLITVQTLVPGRVVISGRGLKTVSRRFSRAGRFTLTDVLSSRGAASLSHHRRMKVRVQAAFVPKARSEPHSRAFVNVTFRH